LHLLLFNVSTTTLLATIKLQIDKRILELQQIGVFNYWDLWFRPMPPQGKGNIKTRYKTPKTEPKSLSLKNLIGAFVVLGFGTSLFLLAFMCEKINSLFQR
jgi:ionotropic glutamate receptor